MGLGHAPLEKKHHSSSTSSHLSSANLLTNHLPVAPRFSNFPAVHLPQRSSVSFVIPAHSKMHQVLISPFLQLTYLQRSIVCSEIQQGKRKALPITPLIVSEGVSGGQLEEGYFNHLVPSLQSPVPPVQALIVIPVMVCPEGKSTGVHKSNTQL